MARLDDLRLIEMRPKLRAKTRVASVVAWRTDGPLRRTYESRIRREFLDAAFDRHGESLQFLSAELSTASYKVLMRKLERLAAEFRDLADLDRSLRARNRVWRPCWLPDLGSFQCLRKIKKTLRDDAFSVVRTVLTLYRAGLATASIDNF
jgi:hypothetical protein